MELKDENKEKIKQLMYLEQVVQSRIHNEISELLRNQDVDMRKIRGSLLYQIDEIIIK